MVASVGFAVTSMMKPVLLELQPFLSTISRLLCFCKLSYGLMDDRNLTAHTLSVEDESSLMPDMEFGDCFAASEASTWCTRY